MINHESFHSSLLQEIIPNTDHSAEDRKQHDHKLGHKSHTKVRSLNFLTHLQLPNIYRTYKNSDQNPHKHKSINNNECETARECSIQSGEYCEQDGGVDEDNE